MGGLPKASPNDLKIRYKIDQKKMRKNNKNKTKMGPSKTQKTLKNQWKNNENQKIAQSHFDTILAPKKLPKRTPTPPKKRSKNEQKTTPKKRILTRFGVQNAPLRRPKNDSKTNKKT